ncbi:hypothetical protein F2Q69_00004848 [Brassica cretica]|uniref:Uncharacterized protein n=1 Tax=Brassica cretica TaxID=69181 RepID=A0A8S9P3J3_BRACR|nr:hypothetical protein F2Q69_00004848 [Brassica cretica]
MLFFNGIGAGQVLGSKKRGEEYMLRLDANVVHSLNSRLYDGKLGSCVFFCRCRQW